MPPSKGMSQAQVRGNSRELCLSYYLFLVSVCVLVVETSLEQRQEYVFKTKPGVGGVQARCLFTRGAFGGC